SPAHHRPGLAKAGVAAEVRELLRLVPAGKNPSPTVCYRGRWPDQRGPSRTSRRAAALSLDSRGLPLDEEPITKYITDTLPRVEVVVGSGDSFFFYEPDQTVPPDHRFPFATLVTGDRYDHFSKLNRPGVFRLNIGVGKQTYASLFSTQPSGEGGYDFTALDR